MFWPTGSSEEANSEEKKIVLVNRSIASVFQTISSKAWHSAVAPNRKRRLNFNANNLTNMHQSKLTIT
ncbi:unnamed protein product [Dicrocoelium dendriticum]|nr:unnamed protein product [Dicrocoelium dendriticum]